jgi:hypothetical protein
MTNVQLYLAIAIPILFNGAMLLLLQHSIQKQLDLMEKLFTEKLLRMEQVLNARLKLIESRLGIV